MQEEYYQQLRDEILDLLNGTEQEFKQIPLWLKKRLEGRSEVLHRLRRVIHKIENLELPYLEQWQCISGGKDFHPEYSPEYNLNQVCCSHQIKRIFGLSSNTELGLLVRMPDGSIWQKVEK